MKRVERMGTVFCTPSACFGFGNDDDGGLGGLRRIFARLRHVVVGTRMTRIGRVRTDFFGRVLRLCGMVVVFLKIITYLWR